MVNSIDVVSKEYLEKYLDEYFKKKIDSEYPEGSLYITTGELPSFFNAEEWELLESNRALWTGNDSNVGTKIEPGLPNIEGEIRNLAHRDGVHYGLFLSETATMGAFDVGTTGDYCSDYVVENTYTGGKTGFKFNASRSNAIYGKSTTVQPAAYVVKVYRRIKVNGGGF